MLAEKTPEITVQTPYKPFAFVLLSGTRDS